MTYDLRSPKARLRGLFSPFRRRPESEQASTILKLPDSLEFDGPGAEGQANGSLPIAIYPSTVVVRDGVYSLAFGPECAVPFSQFDAPLTSLGEGWHFHALHTLFAPLLLMELENETGMRATWFFDSSLRYITNTLAALNPFFQAALIRRAAGIIDAILSKSPTGTSDLLANAFVQIEDATRTQIVATYVNTFCPPPNVVVTADWTGSRPVFPPDPAIQPVAIHPDRVQAALDVNFQERLTVAALDGQFTWPGLLDGTPVPCTAALCLNDFLFAYRFDEPGSWLSFYVFASMHKAGCLGILLPSENLMIARNEVARDTLARITSNPVASIAHFAGAYGDSFRPYLRRPGSKKMAASFRELHLGHHIWNELSGLENLASAVPSASLPTLLPFNGDAIEVFGSIEKLFPEFSGKMPPGVRSTREVIEFTHAQNLILARFTDDYVPAGLRERIIRAVSQTDEYLEAADRCKGRSGPAILIGLRVENRTVVDLPGFLISLVRCIVEELPGALIVLDGQNGGPSFAIDQAARSPAEYELELCQQVQAAFDPKQVEIQIASGRPVTTSIAWSHLVDAFIAFWGAGLAKYRWIANKPGLVISNHNNLAHRSDLHIYDDSAFMADPAPLAFVASAVVTDDPGALQLIALPDPSFANFRVDEAAFLDQVRTFLAPWKAKATAPPYRQIS